MLKKELQIPLSDSVYWTDSSIVLWYLRNEEKRYQTYVANRVAMICDQSSAQQWRYVDTDNNPADDASRGLAVQELVNTSRWFRGPPFLWQTEDAWPNQPEIMSVDLESKVEIKRDPQVYTVKCSGCEPIDLLFAHYSSWYRLKKAVAWILRLKTLLRRKVTKFPEEMPTSASAPLDIKELQEAEVAIITYIQQSSFGPEQIKANRFRKLSPIKSSDGIICVGGRLENSAMSTRVKHPWIIPNQHHVTSIIIMECHEVTSHAGTERVLAQTRLKFWILVGLSKELLINASPAAK
jgi:hypothetical protein